MAKRGFSRERDALAYAADREAEIRHGLVLEVDSPSGRTTVEQWSQTWLATLEVRPATATAYGYALRRILPTFGGRTLAGLRPSELKAWRRGLGERLAPATVDATVAVLAMMLRAAVHDGLLERSPLPPRSGKPAGRLLDPAELLSLDQVRAWGAGMPPVAREMPLFAATTGLRQGEMLGLRLPQVDFLRRQVRVVEQLVSPAGAGQPTWGPPKTAAGVRTVPLASAAVEALARHLRLQPAVEGEPLFRSPTGRRWRRGHFGETWHAGRDAAGLPAWAHWHGLRDVFASSLIFTGRDSHVITTLMGHSSPAELKPYARLWPTAEDGVRTALDDLWRGADGQRLARDERTAR